jgi:hypothetical protein
MPCAPYCALGANLSTEMFRTVRPIRLVACRYQCLVLHPAPACAPLRAVVGPSHRHEMFLNSASTETDGRSGVGMQLATEESVVGRCVQ